MQTDIDTAHGMIVAVDDANFEATVLRSERPWVVNFGAPWCRPCHVLQPEYERLSAAYAGRLGFAKLNADESPRVTAAYGVQGLPTLVFFSKGKMTGYHVGPNPSRLKDVLDRALAQVGA